MVETRLNQSDFIRFTLSSQIADTIVLSQDPIGWEDNGVELTRHKTYHGIMTEFTGELEFTKGAKDYILDDYSALGIDSLLELKKFELQDDGTNVVWVQTYSGIVDYSTLKENDDNDTVSVNFNSNELEDLIKTRESDDFEFEREDSIHDNYIGKLVPNKVDLDGVSLSVATTMSAKMDIDFVDGEWATGYGDYVLLKGEGGAFQVPPMEAFSDTDDRISTPDTADPTADLASSMFFVDSVDPNVSKDTYLELNFSYKVKAEIQRFNSDGRRWTSYTAQILFCRVEYDEVSLEYNITEQIVLDEIRTGDTWKDLEAEGIIDVKDLKWNEGLLLCFYEDAPNVKHFDIKVLDFSISVRTLSTTNPSIDCDFMFVHDAFNRLTNIITGNKNRFVSRTFGRRELGYENDGVYGLIGIISGFWIRQFNSNYDLYKSMQLSLKDLVDSIDAVFNIGLGVELIDGKKKIVVEEKSFFYQNRVIIKLEGIITDIERTTISEDFFSTLEFGYEKGGEYNNAIGLDEPNGKTSRTTPINRNKSKYTKVSKIRADDIGLEIIRRQPAKYYASEDTSQDDNIWFLDLKRHSFSKYVQNTWEDRLRMAPTGLSYGKDFKSFLFTPLRMMLRHGWIIRSGMEQSIYRNKKIKINTSTANPTLGTWFIGEDKPFYENEEIAVKDLNRARTLPKAVKLSYKIDDELLKRILGKTTINYNGQQVTVPNYYFKFEWTNRKGIVEQGYLTSLKPKENKMEFILANK